jgi:hypothetical protein
MYMELLYIGVYSGIRATRSLVLCVCFIYRCLSVCIFLLAIVLSAPLRYTDSDYTYGILLVKIVSGLLCQKENLRFILYVHGTIHFNTKYDYWADRIERNYNTTLLSQI